MKSFRQKEIIEILREKKVINSADIAKHFGVSLETIRRDLDYLKDAGIIKKVYGGAELIEQPGITVPSFADRQKTNRDSKLAIAECAIKYIPDNCVIALDAGTTMTQLCHFLAMRNNLTVICSDIHSANIILSSSSNRVYMTGGFLTSSGTSNGAFSNDFFSNIGDISYFICSSDGVDVEYGLTSNVLGINELMRRYAQKAKTRVLLADHSKFGVRGIYKVCPLSDIDLVITDKGTPASVLSKIKKHVAKVVVAQY